MLVLLFLAAIFAASWAYSDISPENHEFIEMVNQVLNEKGLDSDLINEMQDVKGQLHNHDIKIEHMEREIGDLKLTVENERSQNRELLDLKVKHQQQITGLEMELSHLKAVLLDQDWIEEILPAEILSNVNFDNLKALKEPIDVNDEMYAAESSAKINSDNPKALKEPKGIIKNTDNKQSDSRNMNGAFHIESSQHECPPRKLDQNPITAGRKAKLNKKWREIKEKFARNIKSSRMLKDSNHQPQNDVTDMNHDHLKNQHDRMKRHANTSHIAFSAFLGHNILHAAPGHTIRCDQMILNDGNGYNSHTGIFTVRVTGVYLFTFSIAIRDPGDGSVSS